MQLFVKEYEDLDEEEIRVHKWFFESTGELFTPINYDYYRNTVLLSEFLHKQR